MQKFSGQEGSRLCEMRCNCCGREMVVENGIIKEGCAMFQVPFGFFSKKDGELHCFDLCENCYDKMIAGFVIPAERKEKTELL